MYTNELENNLANTLLQSTTITAATSESGNSQVTSAMNFDVEHKERAIFEAIENLFKWEDKFTVKIGEDINGYIANYVDICNDINMGAEYRFKYFHNIFD